MDKLLDVLANRSPEVIGLIWAIWYMGGKLDAAAAVFRTELQDLRSAFVQLHEKIAVLLDRHDQVKP